MIGKVLRLFRGAGAPASPAPMPLIRDYMAEGKPRGAPRFLMVAMFDPAGIPTIYEQVEQVCRLSRFRFDLLNCWTLPNPGGLELPGELDLARYDGLLIHCTTSYNVVNLLRLDAKLATRFADFRGVKVMMKQDEHYRTHQIAEYLGSRRFDVLLTCVRPQDTPRFYPAAKAGELDFVHMLTGYVTHEMRELNPPDTVRRPIDVGYRGSLQPWNFGRLAWEKCEIGERFAAAASAEGLRTDISSRWEDRFSGQAWFAFLRSCRAVLGVESGASIIDFEGEVERLTKAYLAAHPAASFAEVFAEVLQPYEDNGYYKALSPRHFEAAACKCVQVLYEGEYMDILRPDEHYIPLRRDFSNVRDVIRQLKDDALCTAMTARAYGDLIAGESYTYRTFVRAMDDAIEQRLKAKRAGLVANPV